MSNLTLSRMSSVKTQEDRPAARRSAWRWPCPACRSRAHRGSAEGFGADDVALARHFDDRGFDVGAALLRAGRERFAAVDFRGLRSRFFKRCLHVVARQRRSAAPPAPRRSRHGYGHYWRQSIRAAVCRDPRCPGRAWTAGRPPWPECEDRGARHDLQCFAAN